MKLDQFEVALVAQRVLTSGVIMSIEKNEKEIPSLCKLLSIRYHVPYVSMFNSASGAIHASLYGQDITYGNTVVLKSPSESEIRFCKWLGLRVCLDENRDPDYIKLDWEEHKKIPPEVAVIDFTSMGFGPCAALLTQSPILWERAERLKIFGSFDLKTMWTQEESNPALQPSLQFNYRVSPIVAACVRMTLAQRSPHAK
jgi:dTDP-4-amino-4,6-dideoxygalactose transaminase